MHRAITDGNGAANALLKMGLLLYPLVSGVQPVGWVERNTLAKLRL